MSVPSGAPAHRCGPMPKATCRRMFGRSRTKRSGSGKTSSSRLADAKTTATGSSLRISRPRISTSRVGVRAKPRYGVSSRRYSSTAAGTSVGSARSCVLHVVVLGEVDHHRADEHARRDHPDDDELPDRAEQHVLGQPGRASRPEVGSSAGSSGSALRIAMISRRDVVELEARALDLLVDEVLHGDVELPRRVADAQAELRREVEELGEDVAGQAVGVRLADVDLACADERLRAGRRRRRAAGARSAASSRP